MCISCENLSCWLRNLHSDSGYEAIVRNTQHPVSWEKIQILETPAIAEEVEEVIEKEKPRFLSQLESFTDIPEGEVIHLEATFQPARDPDLKVHFNDQYLSYCHF